MDKLVFRAISAENEIELFLEKFEMFVGVRLPTQYAVGNKVIGVFLQNNLVGGYMIVVKPPFRSVMFVPDAVKQRDKFFKHEQYEMLEVNGVWISPALKSAKLQFAVWRRLIRDAFLARKNYVLLMRDARNKNVDRIHQLTNPTQLYLGKPTLSPDEFSHSEINISYTTRWKLVLGFHRYWREYKSREQREKLLEKRTFRGVRPTKQSQPEPVK